MELETGKKYRLKFAGEPVESVMQFVRYADNGDDVVMQNDYGTQGQYDPACVVGEWEHPVPLKMPYTAQQDMAENFTVWDYYAVAALAGLLPSPRLFTKGPATVCSSSTDFCNEAAAIADVMMEIRSKRGIGQ